MKYLTYGYQICIVVLFLVCIIVYGNCSRVSLYDGDTKTEPSTIEALQAQSPNVLASASLIEINTLVGKPTEISTLKMAKAFVSAGVVVTASLKDVSDANNAVAKLDTSFGKVELSGPNNLSFVYTPQPGFRGSDKVDIYLIAQGFLSGKVSVNFEVTNPPNIENNYSLAVRNTSCIMCHASISGTFVTDMGYGLKDSSGANYFFGKSTTGGWPFNSAYGDYAYNIANSLFADGSSIAVPLVDLKTEFPNFITNVKNYQSTNAHLVMNVNSDGTANLEDYFTSVQPSIPSKSFKSVYIGAPTSKRLLDMWQNAQNSSKDYLTSIQIKAVTNALYFPELVGSSKPISGLLQDTNGVVYNDPKNPLVCEGDILVNAVLRLKFTKKGTLYSKTGCRIYAVKTIFFDVVDQSLDVSSNLQLSSSRAIIFGVGQITSDSSTQKDDVDSSGHAISCSTAAQTSHNAANSYCGFSNVLKSRFGQVTTLSTSAITIDGVSYSNLTDYYTKNGVSQTPPVGVCNLPPKDYSKFSAPDEAWLTRDNTVSSTQHLLDIMNDSDLADNVKDLGVRFDATCVGPGKDISNPGDNRNSADFNHILLNAPYIQARYAGNFSGMIIVEHIDWAKGKFNFQNDTIFRQVPLLPLLDFSTEILSVK